jgi:hypothetical protein
MIHAYLSISPNSKKKYRVIVSDGIKKRTLDFGQAGANDYTITGDNEAKKRYIKRHSNMGENWGDPFTRGFWSRWLTWQDKNIYNAINNIEKKFNIKIFY